MGTITIKFQVLEKALKSLHEALSYFEKVQKATTEKNLLDTYDVVYRSARDSVVQRFEYSIELFWKYLRLYLEDEKKVRLDSNTPRDVVRAAAQARLISEQDAQSCMDMIESRNLTSHIYKEDIAEQLSQKIPAYYNHMARLLKTIHPA